MYSYKSCMCPCVCLFFFFPLWKKNKIKTWTGSHSLLCVLTVFSKSPWQDTLSQIMLGEREKEIEKFGERKTKRKKKKKENKKRRKEKKKEKTYSLPLRERSETPGALDRRALGITEGEPVAQHRLSASVRITGYRRSGCRPGCQESICVRSGPFRCMSAICVDIE